MKAWAAICALLVTVVAGVNLVGVVQRVPPPARNFAYGADAVMRQEQRLAGVGDALRKHGVRGLIGYATDVPPEQLPHDPAAVREYFLSQFTLAPWVLEAKFTDCAWTVANFHATPATERVPPGFRVVEDLGRGVLLLRKGDQ